MKFELPIADPIFQLTFVVLAALLVQIPLERSRIPGLVGLLLVGMLIGPGGLNVLSDEPVVDLLGSVGLLFIMFLAGMEVDLRIVRKHKTEVATIGALGFGIPFATAAAAGLTLGLTWPGAVILGAALSSHTLISYPLIERLGLLHRRPVIATVGGTLFTDTVALTVMIIVLEMQRATAGVGEWLWPLTLLAVLVAVSLIAVPPLARSILGATTPTPAEKALFLLAILLFLASAADLIGTEDILGAFLAGVCVNQALKSRAELREKLIFVSRMIFIPFFFIQTGMKLEINVFLTPMTWLMSAVMIAAVVLGKGAAAWISGIIFGYTRADHVLMISLTVPQAAATLAVTTIAEQAGLVDGGIIDAVIVTILVTCLAGALISQVAGEHMVRTRSSGRS